MEFIVSMVLLFTTRVNLGALPSGAVKLSSWSEYSSFDKPVAAQACGANSEKRKAYYFGGIDFDGTITHHDFHSISFDQNDQTSSNLTAYRVRFQYNAAIRVDMESFYCDHQCSALYNGTLWLVSPFLDSQANDRHIYRCTINDERERVVCSDICVYDHVLQTTRSRAFCAKFVAFQPCVTRFQNLLLLVGGTNGGTMLRTLKVFDMDTGLPVNTSEHGWPEYLESQVDMSSCAVSQKTGDLFIFGGENINNKQSDLIEHCPRSFDPSVNCSLLRDENNELVRLKRARERGRATLITSVDNSVGFTHEYVLVGCGNNDTYGTQSLVEIFSIDEKKLVEQVYDYSTGQYKSIPRLFPSRSRCCLTSIRDGLFSNIFVSGGLHMDSSGTSALTNLDAIKTQLVVVPEVPPETTDTGRKIPETTKQQTLHPTDENDRTNENSGARVKNSSLFIAIVLFIPLVFVN